MSVPLTLSQTHPDFDSLVLQMQLYLDSKDAWKDRLSSSTGQVFIELMAAVGAMNQFAIENAHRNSFSTTAVRDSAIYEITHMLGVRITRKSPASVTVTLTRQVFNVIAIIPAYTVFTVNGQPFFNRVPVTFASGQQQVNAVLYEGDLRTETFVATATTFSQFVLAEPAFAVSDTDVVVTVTDALGAVTQWSRIEDGIWIASATDTVYYDTTLGDGSAVLQFGDGFHGALPPIGSTVKIMYAVTKGSPGNNGGTLISVQIPDNTNISGTTSSAISGGADEKPASYYKALAPHIRKAGTRAVTPVDYRAIVSSYPGVASCTVQAQRELGSGDIRYMNVVKICILPDQSDAFSQDQWDTFLAWFSLKKHAAIDIITQNPVKLGVNIDVLLHLTTDAVVGTVVAEVESRIRSLFAKDVTTLGRRIAISDLIDSCAINTVDYTTINTMSVTTGVSDMVAPDNLTYFSLASLTVGAQFSERALYNEERRRST